MGMLGGEGRGFDSRNRRGFLRTMAGAGLALAGGMALGPRSAVASTLLPPLPGTRPEAPAQLSYDVRELSFEAEHTGESLMKVPYFENGQYVSDALEAVKHIMRDHRNDKEHEIDPILLDILTVVRTRLGTNSPVRIVSAYRSPQTNEMLAAQGAGVAKNSYHLHGQAVDIRMDDRTTRQIHQVALNLAAGGVAIYGSSDFVHVDSGPFRTW